MGKLRLWPQISITQKIGTCIWLKVLAVWVSLHENSSESVRHHFVPQAPQWPSVTPKWFSREHWCRGRSKPGCWIEHWSATMWELTTGAHVQLFSNNVWCQLFILPQWLPGFQTITILIMNNLCWASLPHIRRCTGADDSARTRPTGVRKSARFKWCMIIGTEDDCSVHGSSAGRWGKPVSMWREPCESAQPSCLKGNQWNCSSGFESTRSARQNTTLATLFCSHSKEMEFYK